MSVDAVAPKSASDQPPPSAPIPEFPNLLGHPRPLWMLFMTEFWERFAFYGIRWALVLYIVQQFYAGSGTGEKPAGELYGAYLALVYAAAIFGGYVADRIIGYQRSILLGAAVMSTGLFLIATSNQELFKVGLATIIAGNGLFKPNISTMVGKLYKVGDDRRDSGFTIFYMGINLGAMISPVLTGALASKFFGSEAMPDYKVVFIASGVGMLLSLVWFWFGRRQLAGIGRPPQGGESPARVLYVLGAALVAIPGIYYLLTIEAATLNWWVLTPMFVLLCVLIVVEGIREGVVQRDRALAMLVIFVFNVLFWMFFEQAGSSFTFLAEKIVNRQFGDWAFPVAWFQSVNSLAIITIAPVLAWLWIKLSAMRPARALMTPFRLVSGVVCAVIVAFALLTLNRLGMLPTWGLILAIVVAAVFAVWAIVIDVRSEVVSANPTVPRKFGLGLIFNGLAFLLLMVALSMLVNDAGKIPFWTLFMVYVIQSVGELCLSPIGLSMVTKLAPMRLVGFGMGGWFLSTGIGNNLSGIFAGAVSGEGGMTVQSALTGYTFGFWLLLGAGALLFLVAPLINKLMHGVK